MRGFLFLFLFSISLMASGLPCHGNIYALSSFNGTSQDLEVLFSADGIAFNCEASPITYSGNGSVRDPSIMGPYNGKFWIVHTWNATGFALTSSSDLATWSNTQVVPSGVAGVAGVWAPEWFIDADNSIHVLVAVATEACSFGSSNFQIYEFHPTASDLSTWSAGTLITITGLSDVIDPFMVNVGGTYYLWWKQSCSTGYIGYATSSTLTGTFTVVQSGNWAGWGAAEGPALFYHGGSSWTLYWDLCPGGTCSISAGQIYYTNSTDNWVTWSTPQPITSSVEIQQKQGTVISYAPGSTGGSVLRGQGTLRGKATSH